MTTAILSLVLAGNLLVADRLDPQPLTSFDGKSWSGLTLGSHTDKDIKKLFQTDKGAVRPEALKLLTVKDSGVRVDALLDGRGEKAVMRAIRLEYDVPVALDKLTDDLGSQPTSLYMPERYEDWRVLSFEDRGVVAVEMNGRITTFFLCAPSQVGYALKDFTTKENRISIPRDPGEGWDRIVRFSDTDSTVTIGSDKPDWMDSDWRRRLGRRLENEAESVRESSLRYTSSANGSLSIRLSSERFNKDGEANFTVNVSLSTTTPYGRFSQSASRSRKLGESFDRKLVDLFEDAVQELGQDVRYAVQKLGPPAKESFRASALDRLMANATRKPSG